MMRTLVQPGPHNAGDRLLLDDAESHHAKVRRAADGEIVDVGDGAGGVGRGTIHRQNDQWSVVLQEWRLVPRRREVILAVGAGDRDRFIWLAEKCTELGVSRLIPLVTEHSRRVETQLREGAVEKAQRRAIEAAKQSGNPWTTVIAPLTPIEQLGDGEPPHVQWFIADAAGVSASSVGHTGALGWIIGPEGGLSSPEVVALRQRLDATAVALGPFVLRFETAAVVAAGLAAAASIEPKE